MKEGLAEYDNLNQVDQARMAGNQWINLDGQFSRSKFNGIYATNVADYYTIKARNYFVAPFDGDFSFQERYKIYD